MCSVMTKIGDLWDADSNSVKVNREATSRWKSVKSIFPAVEALVIMEHLPGSRHLLA